jgi:hypothetical protein
MIPRRPVPAPAAEQPELVRIVVALARKAAAEDYRRAKAAALEPKP